MKSRVFLYCVLFLLMITGLSHAQARTMPTIRTSPFGRSITGFMQLSLGLTSMPVLDLTPKSQVTGTENKAEGGTANFPGFSASILLIPTWGRHGITFGASYDLTGGHFRQTVDDGYVDFGGNTAVGIADFAARVGYVHYFGEHQWHPYLLGDAGIAWETVQLESSYSGTDDIVRESKRTTGVFGVGFGVGKEISNGMLGLEARADLFPFPASSEFDDPIGKYDLEIYHPVIIKLMAIFALGAL